MDKLVVIVGRSPEYARMYMDAGWSVSYSSEDIEDADLVQFTGGEDVSPHLYGEARHPHTGNNPSRDEEEAVWFKTARDFNVPIVGICRGGQFVNVMNGGKMIQHITGHATGHHHDVVDLVTNKRFLCTSTHHQMMVANPDTGFVVGTCYGICTSREYLGRETDFMKGMDTEVVYYPHSKSLCFQPHPEFRGAEACREYFFLLLDRYFGV